MKQSRLREELTNQKQALRDKVDGWLADMRRMKPRFSVESRTGREAGGVRESVKDKGHEEEGKVGRGEGKGGGQSDSPGTGQGSHKAMAGT